jgi:AraC-like DNA-binding protein
MAVTQAELADVTSERVRAAVGISQRTLRRRFHSATGMTWRRYLLASRLLRAMALLAERRRSVLEAALEVRKAQTSALLRFR